jgi:hypothetical protein
MELAADSYVYGEMAFSKRIRPERRTILESAGHSINRKSPHATIKPKIQTVREKQIDRQTSPPSHKVRDRPLQSPYTSCPDGSTSTFTSLHLKSIPLTSLPLLVSVPWTVLTDTHRSPSPVTSDLASLCLINTSFTAYLGPD